MSEMRGTWVTQELDQRGYREGRQHRTRNRALRHLRRGHKPIRLTISAYDLITAPDMERLMAAEMESAIRRLDDAPTYTYRAWQPDLRAHAFEVGYSVIIERKKAS